MFALITGASSGIGKAMARELAQKKYDLILVARRQKELEELKQKLESTYGITVIVKPMDLSVEENCRRLYRETEEYHPEIVVNNAGFGLVGPFEQRDLEEELKMIRLNVIALQILTKLFVQSMAKGIILNVASTAAFLPSPEFASYAATKAYVLSFSQAVNYELKSAKRDVRILSLCPGPVETEFSKVAGAHPVMKEMSAEQCAKITVRDMFRKRSVIIPGIKFQIGRFFLRFLPTGLVLKVSSMYQKKKK